MNLNMSHLVHEPTLVKNLLSRMHNAEQALHTSFGDGSRENAGMLYTNRLDRETSRCLAWDTDEHKLISQYKTPITCSPARSNLWLSST